MTGENQGEKQTLGKVVCNLCVSNKKSLTQNACK
jgi:hypothetical protein